MPTETAKLRESEKPREKCGISSTLETNREVRPIPMGYGEEIDFFNMGKCNLDYLQMDCYNFGPDE